MLDIEYKLKKCDRNAVIVIIILTIIGFVGILGIIACEVKKVEITQKARQKGFDVATRSNYTEIYNIPQGKY